MSERPAATRPDLAVGSPSVSDNSLTSEATFSLSAAVRNDGDGPSAGYDAALLPLDRRDDHDHRHLGGYRRGGGACGSGDEQRIDQPDGAVGAGHGIGDAGRSTLSC